MLESTGRGIETSSLVLERTGGATVENSRLMGSNGLQHSCTLNKLRAPNCSQQWQANQQTTREQRKSPSRSPAVGEAPNPDALPNTQSRLGGELVKDQAP